MDLLEQAFGGELRLRGEPRSMGVCQILIKVRHTRTVAIRPDVSETAATSGPAPWKASSRRTAGLSSLDKGLPHDLIGRGPLSGGIHEFTHARNRAVCVSHPADRHRRPRAQPWDCVLPADPRDPTPDLAHLWGIVVAVVWLITWIWTLIAGSSPTLGAQLPCGVLELHRPYQCVHIACRPAVPGVPGRVRVPRRSPDRPSRPAAACDDVLSSRPGLPRC